MQCVMASAGRTEESSRPIGDPLHSPRPHTFPVKSTTRARPFGCGVRSRRALTTSVKPRRRHRSRVFVCPSGAVVSQRFHSLSQRLKDALNSGLEHPVPSRSVADILHEERQLVTDIIQTTRQDLLCRCHTGHTIPAHPPRGRGYYRDHAPRHATTGRINRV